MSDIPAWARTIIRAHRDVTEAVSHGGRLRSDRYFVWQEDGRNDHLADNGHDEICVTGATDLFTKREFDPWADQIEEAFDARGISWRKVDVLFEPNTGFWHHVWEWQVT